MNCGPRSETTLQGMPWSFQTCWTNSLAVPAADRVVNVGMKWAHLVKESTTTNMALWPDGSGSSTMKSMLTISQGASRTRREMPLRIGPQA